VQVSFVYNMHCRSRSSYQEERVRIPSPRVRIPSQGLDFQRHMSWVVFMFNEIIDRRLFFVVDIGGLSDHQCLNFLFIIVIVVTLGSARNEKKFYLPRRQFECRNNDQSYHSFQLFELLRASTFKFTDDISYIVY
jgi:hypothetical protein